MAVTGGVELTTRSGPDSIIRPSWVRTWPRPVVLQIPPDQVGSDKVTCGARPALMCSCCE